MNNLKDGFKKILNLELDKYKLNSIKEMIDTLVMNDLSKIDIKYESDVNKMKVEFDNLLLEVNNIKKIRVVSPKYKKENKKIFLKLILLAIFLLILGICIHMDFLIIVAIIMMFAIAVCLFISLENKEEYMGDYNEYEKLLNKYVNNQNKLRKLKNTLEDNNYYMNKYNEYEKLVIEANKFKNKYSLLKKYKELIDENIDKYISYMNELLMQWYCFCSVKDEYQNYLAISKFYEYIVDNRCGNLEDAYKLYMQEYSFVINVSSNVYRKLNDIKLQEAFGDEEILKYNKILEELKLCIINDKYNDDDIYKLIEKIEEEITIEIDEYSLKIKGETFDGVDDIKKSLIIKRILKNNEDSNISGFQYYGISEDGMIMVADDLRVYVVNKLELPANKLSNRKFPRKIILRMIDEIKGNLNTYVKVKLNIDDIMKSDLKKYIIKYRTKKLEVGTEMLRDTIELLGKNIMCYVCNESEPIYICNDIGEKAILMSNLKK